MNNKQKKTIDDKYTCQVCQGTNKITITEAIEFTVTECETICKECGHKNYWAHGYYQLEPPEIN